MSRRAAKPKSEEPKRGIPKAAAHAALQGALGKDGRAGEDATMVAIRRTEAFLMKLGEESKSLLTLTKRETVNSAILAESLKQHSCAIKPAALLQHRAASRKGLTKVVKKDAAERIFKKGAGKVRVAEEVKQELAAVANAYLAALGEKAAIFATSAKRVTIQADDVRNAAALLAA